MAGGGDVDERLEHVERTPVEAPALTGSADGLASVVCERGDQLLDPLDRTGGPEHTADRLHPGVVEVVAPEQGVDEDTVVR